MPFDPPQCPPPGVCPFTTLLCFVYKCVMVIVRADISSRLLMIQVIVSRLSNEETSHGPMVDEFSYWCKH